MYDRGTYASESGDDTKGIADVITSGLIRIVRFHGIRVQISAKLLDSPCAAGYVPSNPKDDLDPLSFSALARCPPDYSRDRIF